MSRVVDPTPTPGPLGQLVIPTAFNPSGGLQTLAVDADGKLIVTSSGGGGGGTSSTDGDAFTAGVSAGTPIMAEDPGTGELLIAKMKSGTRNLEVAVTGTVPVSGPLTDAQLRATAVPVSGSLTVTPTTSNTASAPAQTTVSTTAAIVLAANASRKRFMLQNLGTTRLLVTLGATDPTQTVYHFALPAGGGQNDGSSPVWIDTMWIGDVRAISSAAGGLLAVTELT